MDLSSLRGQLGVDEIRRLLWDANAPVLVAAARATERLPEKEAATLVPILLRWLRFPDPRIAWASARALVLRHRAEPLAALRDGKLAHLDGLNLSRAWMLEGIVAGLPPDDLRRPLLTLSANRHREAGLVAVTGEHYAGGHWLGSFALYLVSRRGLR